VFDGNAGYCGQDRTVMIERKRAALRTLKLELAESTMLGMTQGKGRFGAMQWEMQ